MIGARNYWTEDGHSLLLGASGPETGFPSQVLGVFGPGVGTLFFLVFEVRVFRIIQPAPPKRVELTDLDMKMDGGGRRCR